MGDTLITSSMDVARVPDLAYIADTHPLRAMKEHKVPEAFITSANCHSSKLYYNTSWPSESRWRVYHSVFPTPGEMRVATSSSPTAGTWAISSPTIPALESWEQSTYGIGSVVLFKTPGMAGSPWKAYYQYRTTASGNAYCTGLMDTTDGFTFTNKRQVTFDAPLSGYHVQAITGAIWDEVEQKVIAVAHVSETGERLFGALVESTDGVNFTTRSMLFDPGIDRSGGGSGDLFDCHWIDKVGSVYVILWTAMRANTADRIETGMAVSVDLDNWYSPPYLIWPYDAGNTPLRYPSCVYVNGTYYVVGVNSSTTGIDVVAVPPSF